MLPSALFTQFLLTRSCLLFLLAPALSVPVRRIKAYASGGRKIFLTKTFDNPGKASAKYLGDFAPMKVKKGDTVVVITGKDKGKKGTVIRAIPTENRIVVEKVNLMTRHQKERGKQPGGRIQTEAPIAVSNVKVICPETGKSTRVGYQRTTDGKKFRIGKKTDASLEKAS
jgi:ribosomal protein L24, bacterial/organelle